MSGRKLPDYLKESIRQEWAYDKSGQKYNPGWIWLITFDNQRGLWCACNSEINDNLDTILELPCWWATSPEALEDIINERNYKANNDICSNPCGGMVRITKVTNNQKLPVLLWPDRTKARYKHYGVAS